MDDVQLFEQKIFDLNGQEVGKIAILVGGLRSENPKEYMDMAVNNYVGREMHNQFIEIFLDNPWTRIVTRGLDSMPFNPMNDEDSLAS